MVEGLEGLWFLRCFDFSGQDSICERLRFSGLGRKRLSRCKTSTSLLLSVALLAWPQCKTLNAKPNEAPRERVPSIGQAFSACGYGVEEWRFSCLPSDTGSSSSMLHEKRK